MQPSLWNRSVDWLAEATVRWLRSRAAFVQIVLATLLWVPLVVFGIDSHGFLYLYIATALSVITQVPLAMIGYRAMLKAESAEERTKSALEGMLATMKAMQVIVEAMKHEMGEQDNILDEIHSSFFMTHCLKCGLERAEGARFCARCGTPYSKVSPE
jgi:hypothetical protein